MYAGTCDLETSSSGSDAVNTGVVNVQLQKQHAIPQLTQVDEARVRIKACCLDEWDVRMRNIEFPELFHPPYTPSYACSGVIDAIGAEPLHFKVGDEVVVLIPLDSKHGGCAEFTVQPLINMFLKPAGLSHEEACAVVWSGIQGFTSLHYQMRVKPGDRILICTGNACTDLVLSSLAGIFGCKVIVATHNPQSYALFTTETTISPRAPSSSASTSSSTATPPIATAMTASLNPLAHILRVVDCSAAGAAANTAVLAAVMEETAGLGVEGVIDLQYLHDEWNFLQMKHVTLNQKATATSAAADADAEKNESATAASSSSITNNDNNFLPTPAPQLAPHSLPAANPITFSTLIQCLAVQGKLLSTTANLQVDPPLSRQLYLRGASLAFLFPQNWILGATQRGRLAHVVSEVLSLAASGTLLPTIHTRIPLSSLPTAWRTLTTQCPVGKIVIQMPSSSTASGNASHLSASALLQSQQQQFK